MNDQEKRQTATRTVDASAKELFDVLSNPERHTEIDSLDMLRGLDRGQRLTKVGDTFQMNMHNNFMGDYQMLNTVVGFQQNKLLAWEPGDPERGPGGWQWIWEFESLGSDSTEVSLSYDWSGVTDTELLKQIKFPPFTEEDLDGSIAKLAGAVRAV